MNLRRPVTHLKIPEMAEISLTKLAEGRHARLRMLSCRAIQPFVDSETLKKEGLGDLLAEGGFIYGLPANVAADETLFTVRITDRHRQEPPDEQDADALDDEERGAPARPRMFKGERVDEWVLTWESLSKRLAETVPQHVREESASVGGSAGLYTLVQAVLGRKDPLSSQPSFGVTAEYSSQVFRSKLLLTKTREVATFTASPVGAVWQISEAPVLTAVTFITPRLPRSEKVEPEEVRLTAFGRLPGGSIDAIEFERKLWHDVSQLLEETK